jgi:hypothetical protein
VGGEEAGHRMVISQGNSFMQMEQYYLHKLIEQILTGAAV